MTVYRRPSAGTRLGIILVVIALLVTGCTRGAGDAQPAGAAAASASALDQAAWDQLVKDAQAEGEVVLYSSQQNLEDALVDFKETYGIEVRIERAPSSDLVTRIDQELAVQKPAGDVAYLTLPQWFASHANDGSFVPLQVSPDNEAGGVLERIDGKTYTPTNQQVLMLAWNTKTGQPLQHVDQVLDAPANARIGILDPRLTVGQAYLYQLWLDEFGSDFLQKLSERNIKVYKSNAPIAQDLAAGALDYAIGVGGTNLWQLRDSGAPLEAKVPDKPVGGYDYHAAVLNGGPNPNAGQLFVNWLASKDAAASLVSNMTSPFGVYYDVPGGFPGDEVKTADPQVWTNAHWDEWIAKEWTPNFKP